jgi:hypothetical protein
MNLNFFIPGAGFTIAAISFAAISLNDLNTQLLNQYLNLNFSLVLRSLGRRIIYLFYCLMMENKERDVRKYSCLLK